MRIIALLSLLALSYSCIQEIPGCTDPSSPSYNPEATTEDGTCDFSIPTAYTFERRQQAVTSRAEAIARQLLISDLSLKIAALNTSGDVALLSEAEMLAYYELSDIDDLEIITPVGIGDTASESTFAELSSNTRLSEIAAELPGIFSPSTQFPIWFENIAYPALGTDNAYTTTEGLDLSQLLPITLTAATLYNYALDSLLIRVDTMDNITYLSGGRSTAMENAWNQAFGYFGAASDYSNISLEALASEADGTGNIPYAVDSDGDNIIDYETEYTYSFARLAAKRDLTAGGETNFTGKIFDAFVLGRAAMMIGPGEEATVQAARDEILLVWERIVAATFVHHLNITLEQLRVLDGPDFDLVVYREAWSAMYGYGIMLAYQSNSQIDAPQGVYQSVVVPLGAAPFDGTAGSAAYDAYFQELENVRELIGDRMGFSANLLSDW